MTSYMYLPKTNEILVSYTDGFQGYSQRFSTEQSIMRLQNTIHEWLELVA